MATTQRGNHNRIMASDKRAVEWVMTHPTRLRRVVFVALLLCLTSSVAHAGIDVWTSSGPGGGFLSAIAVAPSDANVLYAGTYGAVYRSTDGGGRWVPTNNTAFFAGAYVKVLVVDPQDPNVVYLSFGDNLYLTRDGGAHWSIGLTSAQIGGANDIVLDPLDHNTIYVGASFGIWKSSNGGDTWTNLSNYVSGAVALAIYHTDAAQPAVLYAGTSGTVSKSTDGGATWGAPVAAGGANLLSSLAVDPTDKDVVYVINVNLYRGRLDGAWTVIDVPSNTIGSKVKTDPRQPNVVYAIFGSLRKLTGIAADGTVQSDTTLFGNVQDFVIDPQQLTTMYVGTGHEGAFKSTDGGASWAEGNTGIANLWVNDIAVDPQQPTDVYAVTLDNGIFSSSDRGEVWRRLGLLVGGGPVAVAHPNVAQPATVYAVGSSGNTVCKSLASNTAQDWDCHTVITSGFGHSVSALVVDPAGDPTGADVLYTVVSTPADPNNNGVYKSSDSGLTWSPKNTGLPAQSSSSPTPFLWDLVMDPQSPTTLYAIGEVTDTLTSYFAKSTDGAEQWSTTNFNFPAGTRPLTIAVDPHNSDILYVGADSNGQGNGVYKSIDGGLTWNPKNTGLTETHGQIVSIGTIAIDPQVPTTLYAGWSGSGSFAGIFKSIDGGEHWSPLNNGLPLNEVLSIRLAIDPHDTSRIYTATLQRGVMWMQQTLTADLAVSKTDMPDPVTVGNSLTYTITVTNHGPDPATGVVVTETLPQGMTLVSVAPSQGSCGQPSVLSCQLGGLTKDASATITVVVTPTSAALLNNSVTVSAPVTDPNPDNNTATAVTTVEVGHVDNDGDGIDSAVDGVFANNTFTDQSSVFSNAFTDQHLGGTSFGAIVNRGGLEVTVQDVANPAGLVVIASGGAGTATVNVCGFTVNLTANNGVGMTCGSLTAQVLSGPVEVVLGPGVKVSAPTGVTVKITEEVAGRFLVENAPNSGGTVTIENNGQTTALAPAEHATVDLTPPDADGDGVPDSADGCPADPAKSTPGICGCGVADTDSDGDGIPNCHDACPNDANKTATGICGCGVADTDTDHDGTPDCQDACPTDATKIVAGICGCGVPDTDSDSDGVPNCHDACPTDATKTAAGVCGCGVAETDTDHDGTPDCQDACPSDPTKTQPGACGCGGGETCSAGDQCPTLPGDAGGTGCPVADKTTVTLHTVDLVKAHPTSAPVTGAQVRVFDRNNPDFRAVATSRTACNSLLGLIFFGSQCGELFAADKGRVGTCVTDGSGVCFAGEAATGNYLVIVKFVDVATGQTVYAGRPKKPSDFVNNVATKSFHIIKVLKNGVFQRYLVDVVPPR